MTRSELYDSYILFGHTGSENSKEFKEWTEKVEALNEEIPDAEKMLNDLTKWLNTRKEIDDLLAEEADKKEKESLENARMYFGDFN